LKEDDIEEVVNEGWNDREDLGIIHRLTHCADTLQRWGRRKKRRFKEEIKEHEEEMERTRDKGDASNISRFQEAQKQHTKVLVQEETYWRQRAKMHWLKEGDLNTKFFHMSASARSKVKKIEKLMSDENELVTKQQELGEVARKYFQDLFKSKEGSQEPVLSLISPRISAEDNAILEASITKEELKTALFEMHPDKSPGPDGFNPAFFQKFWHLCGDDVFTAVKDWLQRGYFPSSLNETNICLIPKCERPMSMKEFRPISLCNVLYKMVSKLLANRLKQVIDKCISEEQSAFVEGRSITDNALIAIEIIHALKRRTRGAKGELALKIDISKAYDKVEWSFLKGVLVRMGFSDTWVQWMMLCVSSVNYSALVNFEKVGPIHPGRGLRQGDPLSPYLFIMVAEGLTSLIKKAVASGDLHGVKICRGAPMVSHLLFADDCFIFCRSNLSETKKLMEILKIYENASGQEINLSKSEIFFSRNISRAAQEDLSNLLGVRHVMGTGIYLGVPSMVGRSKKATFAYIKDRIWRKINSWRSRPLSKAGKEVMIKSVLQAIPLYVMSIYIIPDATVNEIEKMLNSFWWGGGANNKGIRWMSWERLACAKDEGGLGFRDFKAFNMSMVAKQGWKIMSRPETLVAKIFKARYFPNSSLLEASLGNNPSYVWRSLWKSCNVLQLGCRWSVGDGSKIKIMTDPWLRGQGSGWVSAPQHQGVYNLSVNNLMIEGLKQWDCNKITNLFSHAVAEEIMAVPLIREVQEDKLVWQEEQNGEYTVKSGYRILMQAKEEGRRRGMEGSWRCLWQIRAPPKAKHILWRICRDCLPTRTQLRQHHVPCPVACELCNEGSEDTWHVLFDCEMMRNCWSAAGLLTVITTRLHTFNNVKDVIFDICSKETKEISGRVATLIWMIWNNRNQWLWNQEKKDATQLGVQAFHMWDDWHKAQKFNNIIAGDEQVLQHHLWLPPRHGWLKCNVDAGFHNDGRITSGSWCIRDEMGQFILAGTQWKRGAFTVPEAEALALLEAMQTTCNMNLENIIFESDAQVVTDAVHATNVGISMFSTIISSIKDLLLLNPNFEVKFVKRQANSVAHKLARAANSWASRCVFYSIPPCIEDQLINEMS
jgi:ribonuclease HI